MSRRFLLLLFFTLLLSFRLEAQPAEITYLGSAARIGSANNAIYGPFNIGFNFTFFSNVYTQFYINSNGQINFGVGSDYPANSTITDAIDPNNFIAPFWDDLTIDASGNILYTTIGAAPNRKLIVQFRNMGFYGGPVYMGTFSVILYETSGVIQTQYRIIPLVSVTRPHGESATIGLENIDGTAGALYSYNNPAAITSRQAISFTPSGGNYTINSSAVYDGVYLTTNLTLPEPGITPLISPAENATIGTDPVLTWSASTNAVSYSLKLSTNSSLSGATSYNAGSNLSYSLTGLIPGTTYYWGVFATNATGTTWGEVRKFTVSNSPPLAAVPNTIYTEQTSDKTIKLNYTGGDASAKTAIITALPSQGQLYQYNAGVRGALISTVPTTVSDAAMNVIYYASGSTGNSVGNFSFRVHDNTGDSPTALITVNVSPPGIPILLYFAKSTYIELQFDRPMANPAGKESEFIVTVNGLTRTISSLTLKTGDINSIIATLTPALAGGETVLISYTAGTVASVQGGWLASFTDQTVNLTAQTITFTQPLDKKYSDSPFTLTATATGGTLTYSSSNLSIATAVGSILTFHALGSSDITARQAGDATYAPANYTRTMTVAKGDQTITFSALPVKTYGDADFTLSAVAGSSLAVSYTSSNLAVATVTGNIVSIVGAGSTTITASQSGNTLWNAATDVLQTLTVNKADQTITFDALLDKVFGIPDYSLFGSANSGLDVSYVSSNPAVATVSGTIVHITGVGTTLITASQTGSPNYNAALDVPRSLNVFTANATVTLGTLSTIYNGLPQPATATTSPAGLTVDFTYDGSPAIPVNAGSYTVAASINDPGYHGSASGTLVINKADQTISFSSLPDKTFGDIDFTLSAVAGSLLPVDFSSSNPAVATVTGNTVHIAGVGTTSITASQAGNENYNAAPDVPQPLTINAANATVTLESLTTTYNGLHQAVTVTTSPSGLNVDITYDGSATLPADAGSYVVVASINDAIYHGSASGTLTIDKATLTITADDKIKVFGDINPPLTISYSGFVNGETEAVLNISPLVTTTADLSTDAGTVPITVSGGSDDNYSFIYVNGMLTITKVSQTVTFGVLANKTYGDNDFTLSAVAGSSLPVTFISSNPAVATVTGNTVHIAGAGTATITASQSGNNNYNSAPDVPQILSVDKALLTFTADNKSKVYLAIIPELTYTVAGFVGADATGDLNSLPTLTTPAMQSSSAGTYSITISGGSDNNYTYLYLPGELIITKLGQTILLVDFPEKLLVGDEYTLEATSSSGLPVLFETMDNSILTITGNIIKGVLRGNAQIRAYLPGDINYNSAEVLSSVEVYSSHNEVMHLFTPNNDGFNDYWELPDLAAWGKCDVKVFSRSGKLIFSDPDYNNLWNGTSNGNAVPEGAYYFIIKTENAGVFKGTVNLVR